MVVKRQKEEMTVKQYARLIVIGAILLIATSILLAIQIYQMYIAFNFANAFTLIAMGLGVFTLTWYLMDLDIKATAKYNKEVENQCSEAEN